jgi:hypothetical protein
MYEYIDYSHFLLYLVFHVPYLANGRRQMGPVGGLFINSLKADILFLRQPLMAYIFPQILRLRGQE